MEERLGQYQLIERIAQGGMGEVFKTRLVREAGFEKIVAIKRMLPHLSNQKQFETRFCEEARLSAKLNHANIAHVYDFGKLSGNLFLAMEFVEGIDIGALIDKARELDRKIPLVCAIKIAINALKGLDYAHRLKDENGQPLNLVHRDISPNNILISFEGEVKLTDFGLSSAKKSVDEDVIVGKYSYLPPEEVLGDPCDRRSDIYSLTLVLYEMLFLKKAFNENIPKEALMRAIVSGAFDLDGDIPDELSVILRKGTSANKAERYNTAREMILELEKILQVLQNGDTVSISKLLEEWFPERIGGRVAAPEKTILSSRPIAKKPEAEIKVEEVKPGKTESKKRNKWVALAVVIFILAGLSWFVDWKQYKNIFAGSGVLEVHSTPLGSAVFIDGKNTGFITPAKIQKIVAGKKHSVKLKLKDHKVYSADFTLKNNETKKIDVKLERVVKSCVIDTVPEGAFVWLNDKKLESLTPVVLENLPAGKKQFIRIEKETYIPVKTEFILGGEDEDNKTFKYTLESFYRNIEIKVKPESADIFVDGQVQSGSSPYLLKNLIPDRLVTILASARGYSNKKVSVKPEEVNEPIVLELSPFSSNLDLQTFNGASLLINGKKFGKSANLANVHKKTQLISVFSGQKQKRLIIRADFSQIKDNRGRYLTQASLNFDAQPWAEVQIDKQAAFTTPSSGKKMFTGKHRIKFSFSDDSEPTLLYLTIQ